MSSRACLAAAWLLCALTTTPAVADGPPLIPFKSRELQEGKNYVRKLTATLAVGESSGELTTSYVIEVPPGRGVTPSLALQYSSSGGPSEYGFGWELTLPLIERSPDRFTITNGSHEGFRFFRFRNGHQTSDLEHTGYTSDGWAIYRERRERTFNRYLFKDNAWKILTPAGLVYELGTETTSRRGDFRTIEDSTYAWLVTRISDPHSNYASYAYQPGPLGEPRITTIAYNGNSATGLAAGLQIQFNWQTRTAAPMPFSYRLGYKRMFGVDYLHSVVVSAPPHATTGPALVPANSPYSRTNYFTYSQTTSQDPVFYLTSARISGFPVTSYAYTSVTASEVFGDTLQMAAAGGESGFPDNLGFSDTVITGTGTSTFTKRVFVDVNSDGRPDLVDVTNCAGYITWLNTGGNFQKQTWAPVAIDPAETWPIGVPDPCSLRTVNTNGGESITVQDFLCGRERAGG